MIQPSQKKEENRSSSYSSTEIMLKNAGIAALSAVIMYNLMIFLNYGRLFIPTTLNIIEMVTAFTFLLGLFWIQRQLSERMPRLLKGFRPIPKLIFEIILVSLASLIVLTFLNYLPLRLIFSSKGFEPANLRTASVVSILLGLFYYFFVERERSRKELQKEMLRSAHLQKERYRAQLQHLKDQVQPHFLFNSLNVLGSLIELHPEKAAVFNQQLSRMYRIFLERSDKELVSLKEELELVESYVYLIKTRFGDALEIELDIPPEQMDTFLPPGALQTLIENAIKHNGATRKAPLHVRIFVEEGYMQVHNRLRPRLQEEPTSGRGLENLTNQYRYLTDKEPVFLKTATHFLAKLPLLRLHAQPDHKPLKVSNGDSNY